MKRLNIEIHENVVQEAVKLSDISRIKKLEDERGQSKKMAKLSGRFARSGKVGQWRDYFSQADLDFFYNRLKTFDIPSTDFEFEI